ncbi:MAG: hypothetical protein R3B82_24700 [Sandaracinaceae bacterium]
MDRAAAGVEKASARRGRASTWRRATLDVAEPLLAWEDLSRRTGCAARPEVDDALVAFREAISAIEAAPAAVPKPARALAVVLGDAGLPLGGEPGGEPVRVVGAAGRRCS